MKQIEEHLPFEIWSPTRDSHTEEENGSQMVARFMYLQEALDYATYANGRGVTVVQRTTHGYGGWTLWHAGKPHHELPEGVTA